MPFSQPKVNSPYSWIIIPEWTPEINYIVWLWQGYYFAF